VQGSHFFLSKQKSVKTFHFPKLCGDGLKYLCVFSRNSEN